MANRNGITSKEVWDKLEENQRTLREIAKWIRFQNFGKLRETLLSELDSDGKKLAFENTDGTNGIEELAKICGAPRDTIYSWWKNWFEHGIVEPAETRKGRLRKIFSLGDFGIKLPKTAGVKGEKAASTEVEIETTSEQMK